MTSVIDTGAGSPTSINGFSADDAGAGSPSAIGIYDAPLSADTGAGSPYTDTMTDFQILAAVATSRSTIIAFFSEDVDPTTGEDIANWDISRISVIGAKVAITSVTVDGMSATFTVYPDLSPGMVYQLEQENVESVTGDPCVTDAIQFTTSTAYVATAVIARLSPGDALWATLGRQLNILNGYPVTYLSASWTRGEDPMFVLGTHRFAESGTIQIGGLRITYTERRTASFHGLTPAHYTLETFPAGTRVTFDERSDLP